MADVSVLIVDDQLPFRVAGRAVVQRAEGFVVIGEVDDGSAVVDAVTELEPDLILMDVNMPLVDGIEATRRAIAADDGVTVFLCSTYPLAELPDGAGSCGAAGYLRKEQLSGSALRSLWETRTIPGLTTV
jgi:DNA-binding NarL/FixJ family response regulator